MSYSGKFADHTPFINTAGYNPKTDGITSDDSLRKYYQPRTETPEKEKKYRKTTREEVGVKQIHYGIYDDPKDYEQMIHGIKTLGSDHVDDCIKGRNLRGVNYFLNQIKEEKYAKNQREPLGKPLKRSYNFPEKVTDNNFKFGIPTTGFYNAKDLMYSATPMIESQKAKELYYKSHGITDPGEQKKRNYNWPINAENHIFGKTEPLEMDGTKKTLSEDTLQTHYPKTVIVNKRLEDFRQATSDMLGRTKFKGTLNPQIKDEHTFGKKSVLGENWNVAKCIHGDPQEKSKKHVEPDIDLGKPTVYKSKLNSTQPKEVDPQMVFGTPSMKKGVKEKDAFDLLYPNPNVVRGVDDPDFEVAVDIEQLQSILQNRNYKFGESEFNLIYQITLKNFPHKEGKVSFKAFIDVMRNLKKEFMKYKNLIS